MRKSNTGFFGRPHRVLASPTLRACESVYDAGLSLPLHAHERGHLCLIIGGEYAEWLHGSNHARGPLMLIYYPPDCRHAETHTRPGRHLNMDWNAEWGESALTSASLPDRPMVIERGPALLLALQAYRSLLLGSEDGLLSLEHLLLELLAEVARCADPLPATRPSWLGDVIELLEEPANESLQVLDIAETVRVHPSHLSRSFRKWTGCTLGEFRRRTRVERACRRLLTSNDSLCSVAADTGFSDQSHLTRLVRHATGFTPHALRAVRQTEG